MAPTATTLDELFRALDLSLTLRASNEEEGAWACTLVRPDGATFEIESVTFFDVDPDSGEEWVVEPTPSRVLGVLAGGEVEAEDDEGSRGGRGDGDGRQGVPGRRGVRVAGPAGRGGARVSPDPHSWSDRRKARPAPGGDEHESERTLWCVSEHAQEPTPRWPASASEMQARL